MSDAIVSAASALLGAVVGGAATVLTAWFAAKHERELRKDDALFALRTAVIERHEERALVELMTYRDYLKSTRSMFVGVLRAAQSGVLHVPVRDIWKASEPPAMIFVPPAIVRDLEAGQQAWDAALLRMVGSPDLNSNTALTTDLLQSLLASEAAIDPVMIRWAEYLRSGAYVADQTRAVLESAGAIAPRSGIGPQRDPQTVGSRVR